MKKKSKCQAQITSYGDVVISKKNAHVHDISGEKEDHNENDHLSETSISNDNSENIDVIFEEFQYNKSHDEGNIEIISDNDVNDEELTPQEELDNAIRNPISRENYIKNHYKYDGYYGNNSYYCCTEIKFIDGIPYRCKYRNRKSRIDLQHSHMWEPITDLDKLSSEQTKSISDYDLLLTKIMILLGYYNLSFSVIESPIFWDLLEYVFREGQKKSRINPNNLIKKPSHSKMREVFIETAKKFHNSQLKAFSYLSAVALTLDAGTIQYGHFLDYAISSPLFDLKPYLYEADFLAVNTTGYIKNKTEEIIIELLNQNIKIKAITGDNYPAQLYALSNWSKTSLWRTTQNNDVKKVIFYSCFCHTIQLVDTDVEDDLQIKTCNSILKKVKNFINNKFHKICGKVPDEVETRWFSHFNSLKFLLNNRKIIFDAKNEYIRRLSTSKDVFYHEQKEELNENLVEKDFDLLSKYAEVMVPIYSSTLFFDSNISKAVEIVPIIYQIEAHWNNLLQNDSYEEFHGTLNSLLSRLKCRKFHLMDWPLLNLAYSLTPGGRIFVRKILDKYEYKFAHDKYDNSVGLDPILRLKFKELGYKIKLKQINAEKNDPIVNDLVLVGRNIEDFAPSEDDENQNSVIDPPILNQPHQTNLVFLVGNVNPYFEFNENRSIDGQILYPFERKMSDQEFLYEPGHYNLLKSTLIGLCKRFGYDDNVDSIVDCYDFWIKSTVQELQISQYRKERLFKIWKDLALYTPGWKMLADIATRLMSAQGSETICERKISAQRASINNRRQISEEDLVEARFRLSCNKPPNSGIVSSLQNLDCERKQNEKAKAKAIIDSLKNISI